MDREFEIRKEVDLDASPDAVWHAIATPEGLATWFMPMPMDPDSDLVVAWEPERRLRIEMPPGPDGATQAFEYVIEGRGGTTVLRFVHSGFLGGDWSDEFESMTSAGWDQYLFTLAQYLRFFAGRAAMYVEAEAPPGAATPEAWPRLLAALGSAHDLGAPVGIDLASGAISGSIDYVTANFVGIRTDDALVRFHGRWPIGMTIAVSHHAYAPVDRRRAHRGVDRLARTCLRLTSGLLPGPKRVFCERERRIRTAVEGKGDDPHILARRAEREGSRQVALAELTRFDVCAFDRAHVEFVRVGDEGCSQLALDLLHGILVALVDDDDGVRQRIADLGRADGSGDDGSIVLTLDRRAELLGEGLLGGDFGVVVRRGQVVGCRVGERRTVVTAAGGDDDRQRRDHDRGSDHAQNVPSFRRRR